MSRKDYLPAGAVLAGLLLALDQFTKYLALTRLAGTPGCPLIPGVFELFYLENRGAAFGVLSGRQWFFIAVAAVMMAAAVFVYLRLPEDRHYHLLRVVCVLILAGAAGNMTDRFVHHYVIDFLYFSLIDFPVFNVADSYVCVGAALAVVSMFTLYKEDDFGFLFSGKK